jgi:hypothetical protein
MEITGYITNVDVNLNIALSNISVNDQEKYPQLVRNIIKNNLVNFKEQFHKRERDQIHSF